MSGAHSEVRRVRPARIALMTDFGAGPYVGQVHLRLAALAPSVPVINLIADLPPWRPDLAAYLLPGLRRGMPPRTLYCCVVDPGVGSDRDVLAVRIDQDWLLAPDNGLLLPLLRRASDCAVFRVRWRPPALSASFHGRDLFAPLAARLCAGELPDADAIDIEDLIGADWPPQSPRICYVDVYGNLITGLDADLVSPACEVVVGGWRMRRASTFSDVAVGQPFWYRNAFGLVELSVNQGRADALLALGLGAAVPVDQA